MSHYSFWENWIDRLSATWGYDRIGSTTWLAARSQLIQLCRQTPGGFRPLEYIYENRPGGKSWLHRVVDAYYLQGPLARAVRVRLRQATAWLRQQLGDRFSRQASVSILSLASGGARDVIDVVAGTTWADNVHYLGVDIDPEAVAYAKRQTRTAGLNGRFQFELGNALRPPRSWENRFDIVISLGLFDYLRDSTSVRLIDRVHDILRPGGAFLFGMVTRNPNQRFFEDYLNWKMIYRPPEHILELARASKFARVGPVSGRGDYFFLVECKKT